MPPRSPEKMPKAPVKKKTVDTPEGPDYVYTPPIFAGGMTEKGAIEYLGEKIRMHREMKRKVAWTDDDLYIRHQLIINWLSTGRPAVEVARDIRNLWGVADSTSQLYVKEALQYLTASTDEYRDEQRQIQLSKLERLIEECRLCGKYLEASKFQDQLNKLLGLYQDKKVEVKSDGPIQITFGE